VVAFARQARAGDPVPGWAELAASIADRFGVRVHPRSVERAVASVLRRSFILYVVDFDHDGTAKGVVGADI